MTFRKKTFGCCEIKVGWIRAIQTESCVQLRQIHQRMLSPCLDTWYMIHDTVCPWQAHRRIMKSPALLTHLAEIKHGIAKASTKFRIRKNLVRFFNFGDFREDQKKFQIRQMRRMNRKKNSKTSERCNRLENKMKIDQRKEIVKETSWVLFSV